MMEKAKVIRKYCLKVGNYTPAINDAEAVIDRDFHQQGYIFKDEKAYKTSLDKVCYIPELSDTIYTHQSFLNLTDNQEALAQDLFDRVDWQHPRNPT